MSYADDHETSPPPGGWDLRSCCRFRGLLEGPAELCLTQMTMRPRRPWGAAICETVAAFVGSREVQRSGMSNGHSRGLAGPWGVAKGATVATFVGFWEAQRSGGVKRTPSRPRVSLMGAAKSATVATFVGSWEARRSGASRGPCRDLAAPWGCELCTAGLSACSFA